jgi:hypothetical protein
MEDISFWCAGPSSAAALRPQANFQIVNWSPLRIRNPHGNPLRALCSRIAGWLAD